MKRFKAFFVLFALCSFSYGQVNILKEKQLLVDEDAQITLHAMGDKGFLLVQEFENEESSRDKTWRFTQFTLDLSQQWTKDITLEKSCRLTALNIDQGTVDLIYMVKNNASLGTQDMTIATISTEGEAKTKDFVLKNASRIGGCSFIDGLGYFSATKGNSGILPGDVQDVAYIIDFKNLSIAKKEYAFPNSSEIKNVYSDGKTLYFYFNWSQNDLERDTIISIENGELAYRIPVKLDKETTIDHMDLIHTDSTHGFFIGETKKWVSGSRKFSESYDYQIFIAKISKDSFAPINNVEKKYTEEFERMRDLYVIHGGGTKLTDSQYKISSSFRIKDKNYVVFDKYQTKKTSTRKDEAPEAYFYTNSVVWCFDDEGAIEWSHNIDYEIISPFGNAVTSAKPNANNTLSVFGQFEDEVSGITLTLDGSVTGNSDPFKISEEIDMEEYVVKSNITRLNDQKCVVWGLENETYEQAQKRLKKKDFNRKLNLKIAEMK
jgi:hypothetical protein